MADDGTARAERRRCGGYRFSRRTLTVTTETARGLTATIEQFADPAQALEVVLEEESPLDVLIDPAALEAALASLFFHLRIVDRTTLEIADRGTGAVPQGTVLGNFMRVMDGLLLGSDGLQSSDEMACSSSSPPPTGTVR